MYARYETASRWVTRPRQRLDPEGYCLLFAQFGKRAGVDDPRQRPRPRVFIFPGTRLQLILLGVLLDKNVVHTMFPMGPMS